MHTRIPSTYTFCLRHPVFQVRFCIHPLTWTYTNTRSCAHTFQQNCSVSHRPASTVEFGQECIMKPGGYSEDESTDVFMGELSSDSSLSSRGTRRASYLFRKESGYGSDPVSTSRDTFKYRSYSSVTSNGRAKPSLGRRSRPHALDNHSFSTRTN